MTVENYTRREHFFKEIFNPQLGVLLASVCALALPCQANETQLDSQYSGIICTDSDLSNSTLDPNIVLKVVLEALTELLGDIQNVRDVDSATLISNGSLQITADDLIDGYPLCGLDSGLSPTEIGHGILDTQLALNTLANEPENIQLSLSTHIALTSVLQDILNELNSKI